MCVVNIEARPKPTVSANAQSQVGRVFETIDDFLGTGSIVENLGQQLGRALKVNLNLNTK